MKKVVHLTSVHPRYDTRIFVKECVSLANNGFQASLVVADGKGDEEKSKVHIYDVGASKGRFDRMRHASNRVLNKALELDADVYHFHDPELISVGLKLKKRGKKVIFDAHEDTPKQILSKSYLYKPLRSAISILFGNYEKWAVKKFDAVVAATPFLRDKFLAIGANSVDVNNYPLLSEFSLDKIDWSQKQNYVCYIGGLTRVRGILEIVQATQFVENNARLKIAGTFSEANFEQEVMQQQSWENVDALGWQNRAGIQDVLTGSVAGLVTLHPIINYLDALPVKMFEYMAAGIPVIASDIPLWKSIVDENQCGVCVNPFDPKEIAQAINYLVENPEKAEEMGYNGRQAVLQKYNWSIEEQKLIALYQQLI